MIGYWVASIKTSRSIAVVPLLHVLIQHLWSYSLNLLTCGQIKHIHFSKYKCHKKNSLVNVALYHIHHIWHFRVRLREPGQPIGRLRKTCKNAFPRTIPVSFGRLDTPIATESSLDVHFLISTLIVIHAARGLLTTDHVILNHGQVTWMTPELATLSPNYHTTPTGKRFNSQQI
ncbi:hypothetical protein TNCV_2908281 [Trichonephila clavipes]|nr:hypothetical protein TNCV_2908281 [Trichonephila clavipes]